MPRTADRDRTIARNTILAGMLVIFAAGITVYTLHSSRPPTIQQAYFTDDEGQTWFTDSIYSVPPFPHNGKLAVSAEVFSDGKHDFCGYLLRYTPEGKKRLDAAIDEAKRNNQQPGSVMLFSDPGFHNANTEVRGIATDKTWCLSGDPRAMAILAVRSPDGSPAEQVVAQ